MIPTKLRLAPKLSVAKFHKTGLSAELAAEVDESSTELRLQRRSEELDGGEGLNSEETILTISIVLASVFLIAAASYGILVVCRNRRQGKNGKRVRFSRKLVEVKYLSDRSTTSSESAGSIPASAGKRLELISEIDHGAHGTVYKASFCGRIVAAKVIDASCKPGKGTALVAEKFTNEAETMRMIKHKRIVEFIDMEMETFTLIMEYYPLHILTRNRYMPFGTLKAYMKNHRADIPWTLKHRLFVEICEGMEFLHSRVHPDGITPKKQVYHQDLKCSNVLLYMEDSVLHAKISDFGLSSKLQGFF